MTPELAPTLSLAVSVVFALISAGLLMAFVRLALGPTLPDRVLALEYIAMLAVSLTALYAIASEKPVFLEAAIALALISFLGTIAFSRYVEKAEDVSD